MVTVEEATEATRKTVATNNAFRRLLAENGGETLQT